MVLGAEGVIWFAASALGALGRIDPATSDVTYFPLGTGARPHGLVEAEDRSILAVDRALNVLHRLTPATGDVTRIAMPPELPFLDLASIKLDRDGKVWFSGAAGWLGSHDLASGKTEISSHEDLQGLTLAATSPNGSIWFVAGRAGRMIRFDPNRPRFDSTVLPPDLGGVRGLAVGPLGEVWLSAAKSPRLFRFGGRGAWLIAKMPSAESRPQALVARADGTVVVADVGRRKLVRYTPSTDHFDDIGDLGSGGNIKAMLDLGDAIAIADMGADRIRIFQDLSVKQN
jgi:virginiamycin B lyase